MPPDVLAQEPPRDGLLLGIRPENVEVGLGEAPPLAVRGEVYLVEPMGAETFVTISIGTAKITARAAAGFEARSGAAAWVRPEMARAVWFDERTSRSE